MSSSVKEVIDDRMKALEILPYEVSRRVATAQGEPEKHRQIDGFIRRAIKKPDTCSVETLMKIIGALGGEVVFRWPTEVKVEV